MAPTPTIGERPDAARLRSGPALEPRRQSRPVPAPRRAGARPAAADLPLRRAGRGGEEPRGAARPRSARLDGRLSATVRRAQRSSAAIRTRISSAPDRARRWPRSTPAPTCSFSRRAPTRSASSSSRRWRAGCRSPPFRFPGRSTCRRAARACSTRTCAPPASRRSRSRARRRANTRCASPGGRAHGSSWTTSRRRRGRRLRMQVEESSNWSTAMSG